MIVYLVFKRRYKEHPELQEIFSSKASAEQWIFEYLPKGWRYVEESDVWKSESKVMWIREMRVHD